MPQMNQQFIDILDEEFSRIRSKEDSQEGYLTVAEMAGYLDVDPALLSRYRVGDRPVSRRSAYQFAQKFRPDSEDHQKVLVERLLTARRIQTEEEITVQKWFEKRGHYGFFMAVLFYEAPVLSDKESELVGTVACAIVKGLNYAIVFPFTAKQMSNPRWSGPIHSYLEKVWRGVKNLYDMLLTRALIEAAGNRIGLIDAKEKGKLTSEFEAIAKRIKVFKLRDDETCSEQTIPALGFRMFYCQDHSSAAAKPELWQWNSAPSGNRMLQKPTDTLEIDAVKALLHPISQRFEKAVENDEPGAVVLPDKKELEEFLIDEASRDLDARAVEPLRWEVIGYGPAQLSAIIEHTLSKLDTPPTPNRVKGGVK